MNIFLHVLIPFLLNFSGYIILSRIRGGELIADYMLGMVPGLIIAFVWILQVRFSVNANTVRFFKILFLGFFVKVVILAASFAITYRLFSVDLLIYSISFLSFFLFLLISEVVYYIRNERTA